MTDGYDCYQNALAERVNGILKDEFLLHRPANRKRPAAPSPLGSPNSVFMSTANGVDTYPLQFLLNSARVYACPAVGQ